MRWWILLPKLKTGTRAAAHDMVCEAKASDSLPPLEHTAQCCVFVLALGYARPARLSSADNRHRYSAT